MSNSKCLISSVDAPEMTMWHHRQQVDAGCIPRFRHHIPAHLRKAIAGEIHADIADHLFTCHPGLPRREML